MHLNRITRKTTMPTIFSSKYRGSTHSYEAKLLFGLFFLKNIKKNSQHWWTKLKLKDIFTWNQKKKRRIQRDSTATWIFIFNFNADKLNHCRSMQKVELLYNLVWILQIIQFGAQFNLFYEQLVITIKWTICDQFHPEKHVKEFIDRKMVL